MSDTIIAIDLGRHTSVACVYDRGTRAHTFRTLDTTPADLDRLLARHQGAPVVIEACANAGWVHDRAVGAGHPVKVANTAAESGSSPTSSARPTATTPCGWPSWRPSANSQPCACPIRRPASGGC
jgi:hypothetical protein